MEDKNFFRRKNVYSVLFLSAAVFFAIGFFIGKGYESQKEEAKNDLFDQPHSQEIRQSGYKFISPLLECETENAILLKPAELKIKKAVQEKVIDANPDIFVSLYFRDLNNGPSFGINEQENFSPASLLKVPLMMAYYKYAENDYQILNQRIEYKNASPEFQQKISPQKHIEVGRSYSTDELIEAMIKYSDNEAANLLFQNISQDKLKTVFDDLGVNMPDIYDPNNAMPVKDYAAFFRILYNSSYLSRNMSEKALALLSAVEYEDGILAGIPAGTIVSHKFGERQSISEKGDAIMQLHDCGIIYYFKNPYLLCIMTRGDNFSRLSNIIAKISSIIYEKIDSSPL